MPPTNDPEHYYNNPEKLTQRRNFVKKLRDCSLVGTVVFGGAIVLDALGVIEAPTQEVIDGLRFATGTFAVSAIMGEVLQRSMGNRLNELQQPPEQPQ